MRDYIFLGGIFMVYNSFSLSFKLFLFLLCLVFLFSIFTIPLISKDISNHIKIETAISSSFFQDSNSSFCWPCPNYTKITSPFGKRKAPAKGSSTYHSGIDIAVPTGTPLLSCISGKVTFTGFSGAGGCTLTFQNESYKISYCHISPNYLVKPGDKIKKGQVVAHVGPYNIYGISNNPYKDSKREPY